MMHTTLVSRLEEAAQRVQDETLRHPERLLIVGEPDRGLIALSLECVLSRIDQNLATFTDKFPSPSSVSGVYARIDNTEWTNGFWTGMLWLAYEVTGDARYREVAERHVSSFRKRLTARLNLDHHDLGFLYSLSCVSAYKLTGDQDAKQAALDAAGLLLQRYLPSAGIIQAWGDLSDPAQRGRMIIDCNLNLSLLYWASEVSGHEQYRLAADEHIVRAASFLVRDDASTFHTYFVDPENGRPRYGKTHQGYSDNSCWSRGQAWGIYGFPLVHRYRPIPALLQLTNKLTNYFLNRLPPDGICYWDLHFEAGSQPRDSSAAAITACGLLEAARGLPPLHPNRELYQRAAWMMVKELSLNYLASSRNSNGILKHAVYHMPNGVGVDESCLWGDYFYFEALVRLSLSWKPYW